MVFADTARSFSQLPNLLTPAYDPAMFNNNNNYLPNLNQFGPSGQAPTSTVMAPQSAAPSMGLPPTSVPCQPVGNFRFLSPTQGTAVPTWIPPASSVSVAMAPGVGVSWQHSVPSTMPWANHTPPNFNAEITPQAMTAAPPPPQQQQTYTPQMSERCERFAQRSPSASMVCRRKRHSQGDEKPEGPRSKKYLSEKMASWFKQLQITPVQPDGAGTMWGNSGQDNGWQRFCELEKRLEEDVEQEEVDETVSDVTSSDEPRLVFATNVNEDILTPEPVLPEAIMNRISGSNPCMELVLYKEPESLVRDVISDDSTTISVTPNTEPNSRQQSHDQQQPVAGMNGISVANQGLGVNGLTVPTTQIRRPPSDAEMFDSMDDDMDL